MFKQYDIRGIVGKELTEGFAEELGMAIGTYLARDIVVGRDVRLSSEALGNSLIKGIRSTGCNVIDIGETATPVLYFATHHYSKTGGVMVTASHNPREYNGFKIWRDNGTIHGEEIQLLKRIMQEKRFSAGAGGLSHGDPTDAYINYLKERVFIKKSLKVVVDAGNGSLSNIAPRILKELGCEVVELYCRPDGNFPNHLPDPTVAAYMQDLIAMVLEAKADFGIGFDGDGDRIGVVDEHGSIIHGDMLTLLYAKDIISKNPGAKIIFDVKCSSMLATEITRLGGIPMMWKTGHSLIKDRMKKEKALLGGEMSGHIIFADNYLGFDDAMFACCRLLEIVARSGKRISEIAPKSMPSTPEIRVKCPDEKKFSVVDRLKEHFSRDHETLCIDGVRVNFGTGWGLVRASNTEPCLTLRFEAETDKELARIKNIIESKVHDEICSPG